MILYLQRKNTLFDGDSPPKSFLIWCVPTEGVEVENDIGWRVPAKGVEMGNNKGNPQ